MVAITLPDGSVRNYDGTVTGEKLAADIGPGLAKAALAVKINGEMRDLSRPIESDCTVAIVTKKDPDAPKQNNGPGKRKQNQNFHRRR